MSNTNTDKAMAWWESKTTSERSTLWDKHFESISEIRSRRTIILTIWEKEGQPDSSGEIQDQSKALISEMILFIRKCGGLFMNEANYPEGTRGYDLRKEGVQLIEKAKSLNL